ncbi:hypothetical protein ACIREE_38945 [Streptomyces sp. NPDC102467]|uniref:hypothetical protein n=1 Tax=Streptomyces sp. NPDC102467 TaxID=3366179 RepID=UPI003816515C
MAASVDAVAGRWMLSRCFVVVGPAAAPRHPRRVIEQAVGAWYDDAGNTTSRTIGATTQDLTWDDEGHLATLTENARPPATTTTPTATG